MADRKAVNKYYPPDWDPRKGSLNKYHGSHPLRERARKLDQGILIIRFEMPYNVWCEGCNAHIARGVRYNAEKKQAGSYFSTKIWSFRMKCRLCPNMMEIHTDPENRDYKMVSGVRKKVETWGSEGDSTETTAEEYGTIKLTDEATKKKLASDPFFRLEHTADDQKKAQRVAPAMEKLMDMRDERYEDDFSTSRMLRGKLRAKKKEEKALKDEATALGLGIPLLPKSDADSAAASQVEFRRKGTKGIADRVKRHSSVFHGHGVLSGKKRERHRVLEKAKLRGVDTRKLLVIKPPASSSLAGFGGSSGIRTSFVSSGRSQAVRKKPARKVPGLSVAVVRPPS